MLKKMAGAASELTGSADITSFRPPNAADLEVQPFVLTEEGETLQVVLKSKQDEYCWTDRALIHVDGNSATSTKRRVKRYPYHSHTFTHVEFETAGVMDRDAELKFNLGGERFSIDVAKAETGRLTFLYKLLVCIAAAQEANAKAYHEAMKALEHATHAMGRTALPASDAELPAAAMGEIMTRSYTWASSSRMTYVHATMMPFFERYRPRIYA